MPLLCALLHLVFLHHGSAIIPSSPARPPRSFVKAFRSVLPSPAPLAFLLFLSISLPTYSVILGLCTVYKYIARAPSVPIGLHRCSTARKPRRKCAVVYCGEFCFIYFFFVFEPCAPFPSSFSSFIEERRAKSRRGKKNLLMVLTF